MAKKKTFEKYLEELESLADDLEAGELPLEKALKKYEQAIKTFRVCQQMLKKAEQRIEILLRNAEGKLEAHPFEPGGGSTQTEDADKGPSEDTGSEDSHDELFA